MILNKIRKHHPTIQIILMLLITVISPVVFAQDFNFSPSPEVSDGLKKGAQGWWVLGASVMLWIAIFVAVVCAAIRSLWVYFWVPIIIFTIGYFGGGSVNIMQKHIESSANSQASIPVQQRYTRHENA